MGEIFRTIWAQAVKAQTPYVVVFQTDFIGHIDFVVVRYSEATESGEVRNK
jgi:hypothetical protein